MYTKYYYKHHTLIQVRILNIITKSYSYTSMYTKYNYTYMSTIFILNIITYMNTILMCAKMFKIYYF